MSLNVLIVAEDYRKDEYILKPIVNSMLKEVGKPRANVRVCRDPMISGVDDALNPETIEDVILTNPQYDLFLLLVDRDAEPNRDERLETAETNADEAKGQRQVFFAGQAYQEVEVWLLAGQDDLPNEWNWADVRAERQAKEQYYDPYVAKKTLTNSPGGGRKPLGQVAGSNYTNRVRQLCDEVQDLEDRVAETVE
jgi:hypothetical protein